MKKKQTVFLVVIVFLSAIAFLEIAFAESGGNALPNIELSKGKNHLEINQTLYASELVLLNPEIESISYFDEFLNKSFGYVNVFGGIGSNFLIKESIVYEISVSKNTTLNIYQGI